MRFKSQASQIGHRVANGSPPLLHFFKKSCVTRKCNKRGVNQKYITVFHLSLSTFRLDESLVTFSTNLQNTRSAAKFEIYKFLLQHNSQFLENYKYISGKTHQKPYFSIVKDKAI